MHLTNNKINTSVVINNIIIDFNIANDDFASDTLDPDTSESSLMKHSPILRELSGNVINDNINPTLPVVRKNGHPPRDGTGKTK